MKHVFWLYENQLAGRPGPRQAPWDLKDLKEGGIDTILSVASDLFPHSEAAAAGLLRKSIPFPDVLWPGPEDEDLCLSNLARAHRFLCDEIASGRTVMVHCAAGKDRTGVVMAHYLAEREGLTGRQAIDQFRKVRPTAVTAEGWEEMAVRLIDNMRQAS